MGPLLEKIAVAVGTTAMLGGAAFVYDWNTSDYEVKPQIAELQAISESLDAGVRALVENQARQTIRVTAKELADLDNRRAELTAAEQARAVELRLQQDIALKDLAGR